MNTPTPIIDANALEAMARKRPGELFLKGSGVLKLVQAIRQLEREVRDLRMAGPAGENGLSSNLHDCAQDPLFADHAPVSKSLLHAAIAPLDATAVAPFQDRVRPWLLECFGEMIAGDREERNHRFLEEALELVQAHGCTASEAHQLVEYVYGRPIGEPVQEVGGVMVTLAALCLANGQDMHGAGEVELARISEPAMVLKIRAKQAAKPKHSPLPQHAVCGCCDAVHAPGQNTLCPL